MTAGAVQVCQIDPTRLGGVGEAITCAMMARKVRIWRVYLTYADQNVGLKLQASSWPRIGPNRT